MPKIGDQKLDQDMASIRYIWLPCTRCGKERWITLQSTKSPLWAGLCAHKSYDKTSNGYCLRALQA